MYQHPATTHPLFLRNVYPPHALPSSSWFQVCRGKYSGLRCTNRCGCWSSEELMMVEDFVLLGSLPKLNICSQPLPLTSCRPAPLYGIILVCISHACLVVNCDNIPTIGAGAQTPAGLGLFQAHWTRRTHRTADYVPWLRLTP